MEIINNGVLKEVLFHYLDREISLTKLEVLNFPKDEKRIFLTYNMPNYDKLNFIISSDRVFLFSKVEFSSYGALNQASKELEKTLASTFFKVNKLVEKGIGFYELALTANFVIDSFNESTLDLLDGYFLNKEGPLTKAREIILKYQKTK